MDSGGTTLKDTGVAGLDYAFSISPEWRNRDLYWGVRAANAPAGGSWAVRRFRVAGSSSSSQYSCTPGPDGAVLYEKPNFDRSGGCWTITSSVNSLDGFPGANDNIRSIEIRGRYTVTLYEHPGFGGQPEVFTTGDSDLTANDIHNHTSSVKIESGGCDEFGEGVTLFAQTNWRGICSNIISNISDLSTERIGGDRTYSVRIRGPYKAELFRDPGFTGLVETILTDEPDLSNNNIGNTASSIRVTRLDCDKEGEGVTLFANRNFDGACWTFTADSSDIGSTGLNDSVFSIRIKGPYRAQIYEHPGFSGRDVVQTWEDGDLSNDVFGNGTSSIRVWRYDCNPEAEGVVLFAQPDYGGICQAFTADDPDIGADPIGNDDTYSVRINGPYRATLYVDPGFSGSPQTIVNESIPDLRTTAIGNSTSSLRVVRTKYDLSVTRLGVVGGSITASPAGLDCGPTCTFQYDVGSSVTLNAASDGIAEFAGWGGVCSGMGTCTVTMDASKSVTATFVQAQAALSVSKTGNGAGVVAATGGGINCGTDCSQSYLVGTVVTLSAVADSGSTFTGWSGPCSGTGACVVTVDAAKTVTAAFDRPTVTTISVLEFSPPSGEGRIDDVVLVHARATSTDPIDAIRLLVNGTPSGEISAAEGTFTWNTTGLAAGGHSITVQARLASAGGSWTGATSRSETYTLVSPTQVSPFDKGDGRDGPLTVGGTQVVNVYTTATGSQASTQLTLGSAGGIAIGDELMLHQTQGTGAGQYEFRRVASISGNVVTLVTALSRDYGTGAQAIRVPNYTSVTVPSGANLSAQSWNGSTGGMLVFRATGQVNVQSGGSINLDGRGYRGGPGRGSGDGTTATQGEGHSGVGANSTLANGNGGGAAHAGGGESSSGGGHGGAGAIGSGSNCCQFNPRTQGGVAVGDIAITQLFLGGGGGGGHNINDPGSPNGGNGGGSVVIVAGSITVNGSLYARGASGQNANPNGGSHGGAGGAGGAILLKADTLSLGVGRVVSTGAGGGTGTFSGGGTGAVGRIHLDYAVSSTGSTDPAADSSPTAPPNSAPVLAVNAGLTINQGATAEITEAQLRVTDADTATGQLTYTIGTAPQRGTMRKGATALAGGGTFTQADIDFGLITYAHTGADATADSFTFSVSDGEGGSIATTAFSITVTPPVSFALTVTRAGTGNGTVTSNPAGVDCGADCTESYTNGTDVTLTATATAGSTFAGWSGACTGTATTCTVTMSQVRSVTATFYARNGSLSLAPTSGTVAEGASLTLEITIDTGGHVLDGTDVILLYDPTKFSTNVGAIDTTGGVYASYPGKNVDQANGKVSVSGIANIATGFTGSGRFARVTFTALPNATAGPTAVRFDFDPNNPAKTTDTNLVERGTVVDVLGSVTDGTYTIAAAPAGTVQLSVTTLSVVESAGTATLTVTRTGGSAGAIGVGYATANGTATAGNDYTSTSGTLSWADGESASKSIVVPILDDSAHEGDEAFTVTLSNPTGGATLGTTTSTTVTISANDAAATLTLTKAGTGSGTVTSSPAGINCGTTCSQDYPITTPATSVTLTAAAANGSAFAGWSGAGAPSTCTVTPTSTTCQVTMDASKSVTATFNSVPPPVVGGHGFGIRPGLTSVALSWTGGTAQAGYLLVRPPSPGWLLPPAATEHTDAVPAPGALNCYVLVPFDAAGAVLGNSDVLCAQTGVRSPTGAPNGLTLRLNESSTASLSWTPPGGQTGYYLLAIPLDGQPTRLTALPAGATSTTDNTAGAFTCYMLLAVLASGTPNSDLVCGIAGAAQFPSAAAVGPASNGVGTTQTTAAAETGRRTLRPLAERAAGAEAELKRKIEEGRKKVEDVRSRPADGTPPSEGPRPSVPPVRPGRPGTTR